MGDEDTSDLCEDCDYFVENAIGGGWCKVHEMEVQNSDGCAEHSLWSGPGHLVLNKHWVDLTKGE